MSTPQDILEGQSIIIHPISMANAMDGGKIEWKTIFKQKTAYEIMPSLVGSEMCIRDRKNHDLPL